MKRLLWIGGLCYFLIGLAHGMYSLLVIILQLVTS